MSGDSDWLQILIDATPETADLVSDALTEAGAVAVTLQDRGDEPLYEPDLGSETLWSRTCVTGLFDPQSDAQPLLKSVRDALPTGMKTGCHIKRLADRDWERVWLDHFRPMRFGQQIWICPTTGEPPQPDAINIMLDPGLAFGTGTHPTTALCLEWLDGNDLRDKQVLDYGCGSGILAIAAAKKGAGHVLATDIDPQALIATQDNARRNQVAHLINTQRVNPNNRDGLTMQFDCLLANILANPLQTLAPRFAGHVKNGGDLVLSGILESQGGAVMAAYQPWFDNMNVTRRDEWLCISGKRKADPSC